MGKCPKCGKMTLSESKQELNVGDEEPAILTRRQCSNCGYEAFESE